MAPNSTIFRVALSVADVTRGYYQEHSLVVARHPSETDFRMLVRIVVFALHAEEHLAFGKGLSSPDEPDIWLKDLTGQVQHWIDLGQPTEKRIRQACGKAGHVTVYAFQKGAALPWFQELGKQLERFDHLSVILLDNLVEKNFVKILNRTMNLSCTIDGDQIQVSDEVNHFVIEIVRLKA